MISNKKLFFISLVIILVYCCFKPSNASSMSGAFAFQKTPFLQEQGKDFSKIDSLSLYEAINTYGMPANEATFTLIDKELNEFRIELKNFIINQRVLPKTKIKEVTWKFTTDSLITVWYDHNKTNWDYIHAIKYPKSDEF